VYLEPDTDVQDEAQMLATQPAHGKLIPGLGSHWTNDSPSKELPVMKRKGKMSD